MYANIPQEAYHIHVFVEIVIVHKAEGRQIRGLEFESLKQMLVLILNQVLKLALELVDVMLNLKCKHLLPFSFASAGISDEACGPSKYQYRRVPSQPEVIQYKEAHVIAYMDAVCSRVDTQIHTGIHLITSFLVN